MQYFYVLLFTCQIWKLVVDVTRNHQKPLLRVAVLISLVTMMLPALAPQLSSSPEITLC